MVRPVIVYLNSHGIRSMRELNDRYLFLTEAAFFEDVFMAVHFYPQCFIFFAAPHLCMAA